MKRKLYTLNHDLELLRAIENNGGQFTAAERAYVTERELGDCAFTSRGHLLRYYLPAHLRRLASLSFLIDLIRANAVDTVLSLGSGACVLEYLLKLALPEKCTVVATDFDTFSVRKAREFFPELVVAEFDLFRGGVAALRSQLHLDFKMAVFFGSAYVMNDEQFIKLFRDLGHNGVQVVVDFHAGYMDARRWSKYALRSLLEFFGREPTYQGKFHGWTRSRRELRRLYAASGWQVAEERSVGDYLYVATLR